MRRLGIDLRVLQIGHQFRGIGEHTKHLISHFPDATAFDNTEFVFYTYSDQNDPTQFVKEALRKYPFFEVETIGPAPRPLASTVFNYASRMRYDYDHAGEDRLADADVDSMLFIDFQLGVPAEAPYKKTLMMYDLIPYLFPDEYHPTFRNGRSQGAGIRAAGTDAYRNWQYTRLLERATSHADKILSISHHTKSDLIKELAIPSTKVETIPLGVEPATPLSHRDFLLEGTTATNEAISFSPCSDSFVFYIGGSDFRRRIPHLFESYEAIRASGREMKLVLAGADFASIDAVPEKALREAILNSKYADDVYFFGYVSEAERTLLYQEALAFVYPTLYEGFGLPILEAMSYGCPVITYANSSTTEVGGDAALYADDVEHITTLIDQLLTDDDLSSTLKAKGLERVQKFTWPETASRTLAALVE